MLPAVIKPGKCCEQNLEQVEQLAKKAVDHTIQVDDELSFLFELKALFEHLDQESKKMFINQEREATVSEE